MEEKEMVPAGTDVPEEGKADAVGTEQVKAAYEEKLRQVRIDGEVRFVLARMGARNPAVAAKALDLTGVAADENGVTGVEDSVKRLMASDPYLFGAVQMAPSGRESSSGGVHGETRRDPDTMSDREYYDMILKH